MFALPERDILYGNRFSCCLSVNSLHCAMKSCLAYTPKSKLIWQFSDFIVGWRRLAPPSVSQCQIYFTLNSATLLIPTQCYGPLFQVFFGSTDVARVPSFRFLSDCVCSTSPPMSCWPAARITCLGHIKQAYLPMTSLMTNTHTLPHTHKKTGRHSHSHNPQKQMGNFVCARHAVEFTL